MDGEAFYWVDNLKRSIKLRLNPTDNSQNSQCREILKLVYKQVESFEELAKRTLNPLDGVICGEVEKLRGIVREIGPKSDLNESGFQNLKEKIKSFTIPEEEIMKHSDGLYNTFADYEDDGDDYGDVSSEMIGMREVYQELKDKLMREDDYYDDYDYDYSAVTSLVGMAGIGKTAMANKIFNDPEVVECFDNCVWVRVGKKYRAKDIPRLVLEEIDPDCLQSLPEGDEEESVAEHLNACLKSKKYLVVLDDVWDRFTGHLLYPYDWYELDQPFLHEESRSQILITSRLEQLDKFRYPKYVIKMRLLNKEESWDLFRGKVFSQGSCPPQFVKAGKKISKKCDGLPLTILAVARLLFQEEEKSNPEFWNEVATKKNHQIFINAYDEISKVLLPSYTYLPPLLQFCFMFIGLFPKKYEVLRSKLFNLWGVDGFYELNAHITSDKIANECLEELVSNSVVMVYKHSSSNSKHKVKTCGLHSSLWHLSKKRAKETKFALILSSKNDVLEGGIEGHKRLSFQN